MMNRTRTSQSMPRLLVLLLLLALPLLVQTHPPGSTPGCPTDEYSTLECAVVRLVFENTGLNAVGRDIVADTTSTYPNGIAVGQNVLQKAPVNANGRVTHIDPSDNQRVLVTVTGGMFQGGYSAYFGNNEFSYRVRKVVRVRNIREPNFYTEEDKDRLAAPVYPFENSTGRPKSQGFQPSAGAHSRHPAAGWARNLEHGKLGHPARLSLSGRLKSQGFQASAGAHSRLAGLTESSDIVSDFPWGRCMRSQGSHASAGAHSRHPAAGWIRSAAAWCEGAPYRISPVFPNIWKLTGRPVSRRFIG